MTQVTGDARGSSSSSVQGPDSAEQRPTPQQTLHLFPSDPLHQRCNLLSAGQEPQTGRCGRAHSTGGHARHRFLTGTSKSKRLAYFSAGSGGTRDGWVRGHAGESPGNTGRARSRTRVPERSQPSNQRAHERRRFMWSRR